MSQEETTWDHEADNLNCLSPDHLRGGTKPRKKKSGSPKINFAILKITLKLKPIEVNDQVWDTHAHKTELLKKYMNRFFVLAHMRINIISWLKKKKSRLKALGSNLVWMCN